MQGLRLPACSSCRPPRVRLDQHVQAGAAAVSRPAQQQGRAPHQQQQQRPRRAPPRAVSSRNPNAADLQLSPEQQLQARQAPQGSPPSPKQAEPEDDRELHRLLKESRRQLQLPEQSEEDEDDASTAAGALLAGFGSNPAAAAVAAAAMSAAQAAAQQQMGALGGPPPAGGPAGAAAAAAAGQAHGRGMALSQHGQLIGLHPISLQQQQQQQQDATPPPSLNAGSSSSSSGAQQQQQQQADPFASTDGQPWPGPPPPSGSGRAGCPVYVMLPLDTVWVVEREGLKQVAILKRERALEIALHTLRQAGVEGVMVDVWWGICERSGPQQYDFSAYRRLFNKCAAAGLKVQAVMSFHAAGGNVGDTCKIPLPKWVVDIGERNPDIFYTDKQMHRNKECLSLGCDDVALFWGRSPVDMYRDFIDAFADAFQHLFGAVISEVTVGLGPAGELRYPSYPEGDARWRFPGVGEYQCCDRYMLEDLRAAAAAVGHPEWGHGGPHDAGHYNAHSWETGFFKSQGGRWQSEYGHFFQSWYSGLLVRHARRVLGAAAEVLNKPGRPRVLKAVREVQGGGGVAYEFAPAVQLGAKLAGVHWWFKSSAHAAELTAGYYNTRFRDGYAPIIQVIAEFSGRLSFTCVEMRDCEHPPEGRCSPQGLLQQVLETAEQYGVPLAGENALQRYDEHAFDRIAESAFGRTARAGRLEQLTFLRMGDLMFDNWDAFCAFLRRMRGDLDEQAAADAAAAGHGHGSAWQQQQQQAGGGGANWGGGGGLYGSGSSYVPGGGGGVTGGAGLMGGQQQQQLLLAQQLTQQQLAAYYNWQQQQQQLYQQQLAAAAAAAVAQQQQNGGLLQQQQAAGSSGSSEEAPAADNTAVP